jgi:hypothetical protein
LDVLVLSTYNFHVLQSWMQLVQFFIFSFFMSFLMSPSHLLFGLPSGRVSIGFHLNTFFTIPSSNIRCKWPNQLNLCAFMPFITMHKLCDIIVIWCNNNNKLINNNYGGFQDLILLFEIATGTRNPFFSICGQFWHLPSNRFAKRGLEHLNYRVLIRGVKLYKRHNQGDSDSSERVQNILGGGGNCTKLNLLN